MIARLGWIALAATVALAPTTGRAMQTPDSGAPRFSAVERDTLDHGGMIVELLPPMAREITLVCAIGVRTSAEAFVKWAESFDAYQRGDYVQASQRFSQPPRLSDLDRLQLNEADLTDLRRCDTGDCGLKLSSAEIVRLRAAASGGDGWRARTNQVFRELVLGRAQAFEADGVSAMPPYNDHDPAVSPGEEFRAILTPPAFMTFDLPELNRYLLSYPRRPAPAFESYLYWSIETLGRKPIVTITHVSITRPAPPAALEVVVASRNVFASHYIDAGLAVTGLGRGRPGMPRDLIYRHRARVDMLGGAFGGWMRQGIQSRIRKEAPGVLARLRYHLETHR